MKKNQKLLWALCLGLVVLVAEFFGGIYAESLSLLSDAGHLFIDNVSLAVLTYMVINTTGVRDERKEVFMGLISAGLLICFLFLEVVPSAISKLQNLNNPNTSIMNVTVVSMVSVLGLITNIIVYFLLKGYDHSYHQGIESVIWHNLTDLGMSVIVIVAVGLTWWTGSKIWDPVLSLVFVGLLIGFPIQRLIVRYIRMLSSGTLDKHTHY